MRRFHFTLRPLTLLREHAELVAREALAISIREMMGAELRLSGARCTARELGEMISAGRRGTFLASEASGSFRAFKAVLLQVTKEEGQVAEAGSAMEKRRIAYLEARRALEGIKRLEEKARGRHRAETVRLEQLEQDDFVTYRTSRRKNDL